MKKKHLERQLKVFGELFEDLRANNVLPQRLPQGPRKMLPEPVEKEMLLTETQAVVVTAMIVGKTQGRARPRVERGRFRKNELKYLSLHL